MTSTLLSQFTGSILRPIFTNWSRRRLPKVKGVIHINGLERSLAVERDSWGIPTIRSHSRHDLFFGQGFVHAQDRLWQLDIHRRAANGRLAEVLGADALETDRLTRTLGFRRHAQLLWDNSSDLVRGDIEAYSAGINAFLQLHPKLSIEFSILGYKPDPWKPTDTVAFGQLLAWTLSSGWAAELSRARLIQAIGQEKAGKLEPKFPERNPITLPRGIEYQELEVDPMVERAGGPFLHRSLEGSGRGSNGWVISGARSTTGKPILCNDMHLPVPTPSLWYFLRMVMRDDRHEELGLYLAGVSQPGLPYVLIGHNQQIAWGATLTLADTEDLFIERIRHDTPSRYKFRGEWLSSEIFEEVIQVKGQADHLEKVLTTHHGPMVSSLFRPNGTGWNDASKGEDSTENSAHFDKALDDIDSVDTFQALTLRSVALGKEISFDGFAKINLSKNWGDFTSAVREIHAPSMNLLFADVAGNIGYYMSGRIPLRAKSQGLIPVLGWTGEEEWIGHVPFEQMPHAFNPDSGFVVTANNKIIGEDYPYYLGSSWRNGYRAARIEEMILSEERISPKKCLQMQMDLYSIPGVALAQHLNNLELNCESESELIRLLGEWDGYLSAESIGGTVYKVLQKEFARVILGSQLGEELLKELLGAGPHPVLVPVNELSGHWISTLLALLEKGSDLEEFAGMPMKNVVCQALMNTKMEIERLLGSDPRAWSWGSLHHLTFHHTFSVRPILGKIFSHGPFPIGGDADTILQVAVDPAGSFHDNSVSPSYRQVIDLGDLANSKAVFAPGQSGHLGSKHYGDLIEPWLKGESFSMDWSSENDHQDSMLVIMPLPAEKKQPL